MPREILPGIAAQEGNQKGFSKTLKEMNFMPPFSFSALLVAPPMMHNCVLIWNSTSGLGQQQTAACFVRLCVVGLQRPGMEGVQTQMLVRNK